MNNSAVYQSLIDIEENLQKLESARTQVSRVSEYSMQLATTVAELVQNIQTLQDEFGDERNNWSDSLNKSLSGFNKTLDKNLREVLGKSVEFGQKQQKSVNETVIKLDGLQDKIKAVEKTVQDLDFTREIHLIYNKMDGITSDLHKTKEGLIKRMDGHFKEIRELQNSNQNKQLLSTIGLGAIIILILLFREALPL
jgi:hypothetical protein